MATPVAMPSLGMVMTEGKVARWIAAEGATVAKGEPIVEIETDKLTQEIGAPAAGVVHRVAEEGAVLPVEGLIALILAEGETAALLPGAEDGLRPGEGLERAGARELRGDAGGAVGPHPRSADSPPPREGVYGDAPLSLGWPAPSTPLGPRPALEPDSPLVVARPGVPVSPVARRLARELGVDLARVKGSGPGGRIVEADVRAVVAGGTPSGPVAGSAAGADGVVRRVPFTGARRVIAERMTASLAAGAQLTISCEVDAGALVAVREATRGTFGALPYDAYVVRALALGLAEDPTLNAAIEGDEIVVYGAVHVGIAVALPGGLLVPVVRDAATATLAEIAHRIADLTARARAGRLSPDDLAGGTITVTNLGGYGVDVFTPILNPPQSAILGVGRIAPRAVVAAGGGLVAQPTVHLSLTFDHRVADGAPAAELLGRVARLLEDPRRLG